MLCRKLLQVSLYSVYGNRGSSGSKECLFKAILKNEWSGSLVEVLDLAQRVLSWDTDASLRAAIEASASSLPSCIF